MSMTVARAALHEAGHALVAHALGWIVEEIVVMEGVQGVEAHTVAAPSPEAGPPEPWDNLRYACGGIVAEAINVGVSARMAVREVISQGARDGIQITRCLEALPTPRQVTLERAADDVEALLGARWPEVTAIAAALETHGVCHLRPPA